jgi:hypothetical protein
LSIWKLLRIATVAADTEEVTEEGTAEDAEADITTARVAR